MAAIVKPFCKSKEQYQKLLGEHVEELSSLQQLHYASNRFALMLIFQRMDADGKDGAIRHVISGVNPQGCQVFSFRHLILSLRRKEAISGAPARDRCC